MIALNLITNLKYAPVIRYQPATNFLLSKHMIDNRHSDIRSIHTIKRRKRYPFFWLQDKYRAYYDEQLTGENERKFQEFLKTKYSVSQSGSPLKLLPWSSEQIWQPHIRRAGVLGKKLGNYTLWSKEGKRITTTLVQILDNHVISYQSPEEFQTLARPVDKARFPNLGRLTVGSESADPRLFTAEYNGLFSESGVMPKRKLTRFMISHESRLEPGTPLLATHFRPGMFVTLYGKTIERGPSGVRDRYALKLGQKTHGTTKSHNRIGSIGRGRKECGPLKGRRMPGHDGGERIMLRNLRIWRINTKYNLLWLSGGSVPGEIGSYTNIIDSISEKNLDILKSNPPPFPTISYEDHIKLDENLYDPSIHLFEEPSLEFEETEEEKRQIALLEKKGKAKTAQKFK